MTAKKFLFRFPFLPVTGPLFSFFSAVTLSCASSFPINVRIENFRQEESFAYSNASSLIQKPIGLVVFGNQINSLVNVGAFKELSTDNPTSKTLGERIKDLIKKVDKNKLKYYFEDTRSFANFASIEEFQKLLSATPQFSSDEQKVPQNLAAAVKESDVVILQSNIYQLLSKLVRDSNSFLTMVAKNSLSTLTKAQFIRYYSEFKQQFLAELKKFQVEHRSLIEKVRELSPKAGVVVLGSHFLQEEIFDTIFSKILQKFEIREQSFVKQVTKEFNRVLQENARKTDTSFLSFDPRNIFVVKKGLIDTLFSFVSKDIQEHSMDVWAKLIFLKLSAPERFFYNFKNYFKGKTKEEDLDKKNSFLDDFSSWLGVQFAEENNNTEYHKHFYFSQEQEKFIQKSISTLGSFKKFGLEPTSRSTVHNYLKQFLSLFFTESQINTLVVKYSQYFRNVEEAIVFVYDILLKNQVAINFLSVSTFFSLVFSLVSGFAQELTAQQKERIFSLLTTSFDAVIEDYKTFQYSESNKLEVVVKKTRELYPKYTKLVIEALRILSDIADPLFKAVSSISKVPFTVEEFRGFLVLLEAELQKVDIEEVVREFAKDLK